MAKGTPSQVARCSKCGSNFILGPDDTLVIPCAADTLEEVAEKFRTTQPNFHVAVVCADAIRDMSYADSVKLVELIRGSMSVQDAVELMRQRTLMIQKPGEWA